MTDHRITRAPAGDDALAPLAERDPVLTEVLFLGEGHPDGALGEVYRAVAALRVGSGGDAVEHLERNLVSAGPLPPEPWIELAVGQMRQRRFAAAEQTLVGVLERWPQDAAARERLPIALSGLGRPEDALEAAETATRARPERAESWFNLGLLREAAGRIDGAREALEHALRLRPNMTGGWVHLGRVQRRLGAIDEARRSFERALALDPSSFEAQGALAGLGAR
jgi:tetratricopeptide (TPR) repeat protein